MLKAKYYFLVPKMLSSKRLSLYEGFADGEKSLLQRQSILVTRPVDLQETA
jgi:hypothetical protein